ncbi:sigma factor-like helix-turn-helix DNA-binding protein [Patulibacter medicamentivorans]|nr:sigma-70 region 4 domain-containing protein [Patulibacter medicamentivorans]
MAREVTVDEAAALLPWPQREALALLADGELGYSEIAGITGASRGSVARTVVAARIGIADRMGGTHVADELGRECWAAAIQIAAAIDGESWAIDGRLAAHRERCPRCRAAERGLEQATRACEAWRPDPPRPGWRERTLRRCGAGGIGRST